MQKRELMGDKSIVAVQGVDGNVYEAVKKAMDLAGWTRYLKQNQDIALKLNLGWDLFIPGAITSPLVTESVIRVIYDHVDRIYLVESDQVLENIEKAFYRSNTNKICDKYEKVTWHNMSRHDRVEQHHEKNAILKTIEVPRILLDLDFITIPVMKTHDKSTITCALKNQWGCLSKLRHEYHLVLNKALADINSVVRPLFTVVDATIALEGSGPKNGRPKVMDLILSGHDPVAVDCVAAEIMGFDSSTIEHLHFCAHRGLGNSELSEIDIVGEKIDAHRTHFAEARHNLISRMELFFRQSFLKKLLFNTFIFQFALIFGKTYYRIWFRTRGRKIWRRFLNHPVYGKQWGGNPFTEKLKKGYGPDD
jgi:uncharacterized protein (DUF362 family)